MKKIFFKWQFVSKHVCKYFMKNKNINDFYKCKSNKIAKSRTISLNVMLWRVLKTYIKIGKNGTIESRMETHMPVRAETR